MGDSVDSTDSIYADPIEPDGTQPPVPSPPIPSAEANDQKIYDIGGVEIPPEFPGGQKELVKFLNRNLKYPPQARSNNVEGKVFTGFVVEKNGTLSDFKVLRGIGSGCDEEALRVIRMLPAWKPAMVDGKPVRNSYVLSVTFKISD
nr:energy transducer TonB [Hufsiella ginkgonis]